MNIQAFLLFTMYQVVSVESYIDPILNDPLIKLDGLLDPPRIKYPPADKVDNESKSSKVLIKSRSTSSPSRYPDYPSFFVDENRNDVKSYVTVRDQKEDTRDKNKFPLSDISAKHATIPFFPTLDQLTLKSPFEVFSNTNQKRRTRLIENRSYSKATSYEDENLMKPPMLKDLSPPQATFEDTFWVSLPAGLLSFVGPYVMFPKLVSFMHFFIGSDPTILNNITDTFGPGVSILYGTFVSLTLSILYKRQQEIQNQAATESSLLAMTARNLLHLFKSDQILAIEAGQSVADQIKILADGSRGTELMMLMYNDPYARMLELLGRKEREFIETQKKPAEAFNHCRDSIRDLYQIRARRLSDEALALPQNHFLILTSLTGLILLGYTIEIVMQSSFEAMPLNDSSLVFGLLCSVYMLFYNFANDLNDPFGGIYQVRRSATASHLLQIKWLIVNHPMLSGEVHFNTLLEEI